MLREALLFLSDSRLARRFATGAPLARTVARRFVAGETIDDAVSAARELNAAGTTVSLDYLGESVRSREEARAAADVYLRLLDRMEEDGIRGNISLKLTQLGQDIDEAFVRENVLRVLDRAAGYGRFVRFDMESSAYTRRTLDLAYALHADGHENLGAVIQSYLHRSEDDVRELNRRRIGVRLCKGAYKEPPSIAYQAKREVDENFIRLMRMLLAEGNHPGIATHDEAMIRATKRFAEERGIPTSSFEFQMLYGVRRDVQRRLVADGYDLRIYIPFGGAWYPYLMRRLAERPANVFFIVNSVLREGLGARDGRRR
ncbi:MAG: proline dehydrogenase family protein [Gemmatimonadota bacterium]